MKTILPATLVLLAAALLGGCAKNPSAGYQGYVEAEYVYVASPLAGTLTNLAGARGDSVKQGQLLFELERAAEATAVTQAEKNLAQTQAQLDDLNKGKRPTEIAALTAQLEQAKASLTLAESDLSRREQLGGGDVVSKEELDRVHSQKDSAAARVNQLSADLETAQLGARADAVRAAQAAVEAQRAALAKAQWAFDQKQQFAPTDAQIHDTLYRSGEFVVAGNPVVALLPPQNLKVRFFVPQGILPQIKIGQSVSVHCDGAPKDFSATVNYLATQAEYTPPVIYSRETRAEMVFMIEAKFSPADAANVRPGQPVDVTWN